MYNGWLKSRNGVACRRKGQRYYNYAVTALKVTRTGAKADSALNKNKKKNKTNKQTMNASLLRPSACREQM
jgi:hypothetical protein